jgi:tRNA 2-thiouridine synthesizing protein A
MNYFGAARHSFRFGVDGVSPNKTSRFLMSDTILEEAIMEFHKELDARGLNCPLPILKAKKRWQNCRAGSAAHHGDRPRFRAGFQAFCKQTGNALLSHVQMGREFVFLMRANKRTSLVFPKSSSRRFILDDFY